MSGNDIDYEKKFQEDLEKAQALSLETLALEKYRMQKLYKQQTNVTKSVRETQDVTKPPVADPGLYNLKYVRLSGFVFIYN